MEQGQSQSVEEMIREVEADMPNAFNQDRVRAHTSQDVNDRIDRDMECSIAQFLHRAEGLEARIDQLRGEWDIERMLQLNASAVVMTGLVMGTLFGRRWNLLSLMAAGFLMQHALQGWCPPVSLLRRMGVRTQKEIDQELYALKVARGDFKDIQREGQDKLALAKSLIEAAEQ